MGQGFAAVQGDPLKNSGPLTPQQVNQFKAIQAAEQIREELRYKDISRENLSAVKSAQPNQSKEKVQQKNTPQKKVGWRQLRAQLRKELRYSEISKNN
ncbi:MAG: hypothetical protein F6K10_22320 [Moorea sp. SIO2B7]|nr:hypothetical protein [Moorena sp. SIO2B7]